MQKQMRSWRGCRNSAVKGSLRGLAARRAQSISVNDGRSDHQRVFLEQGLLDLRQVDESSGRIHNCRRLACRARAELNNARLRYERRDGTIAELVANYHADDIPRRPKVP